MYGVYLSICSHILKRARWSGFQMLKWDFTGRTDRTRSGWQSPWHSLSQPVPKAYRKWCVKFRTTQSVRTGFPAVIQHSLSEHLKRLKLKTWNDLTSANFFLEHRMRSAAMALCPHEGTLPILTYMFIVSISVFDWWPTTRPGDRAGKLVTVDSDQPC